MVKDSDFILKSSSNQDVSTDEPSKSDPGDPSGKDSGADTKSEGYPWTTSDGPGKKASDAAEESKVKDELSDFEIVAPNLAALKGESKTETFENIVKQLNEDKIETWLNLWDLLDKNETLRHGLDTVKSSLMVAITAIEEAVKLMKKAVKLALAFAGSVLDLINTQILALKAIIKSIKKILSMIEDLLEIDLFRAELKVASFSFIPNLNAKLLKKGNMAPLVRSKLNSMSNDWFNHPEVEDGLCCAMFIPIAVPKELTQLVSSCIKIKDLIQEWVKTLMEEFGDKPPVPKVSRGELEGLIEMLDWLYLYDSSSGTDIGPIPDNMADLDTFEDLKAKILDDSIKAVDALGESEPDYLFSVFSMEMKYVEHATKQTVSAVAQSAYESDGIQGVVDYRAHVDPKDSSAVILETNFKTDQYRFLSEAYKITADGEPELIFSSPSIKAIKVLATAGVVDRLDYLSRLYLAYARWSRSGGDGPQENKILLAAFAQFFNKIMGSGFYELEDSLVTPNEKLVFMTLGNDLIQTYKEDVDDPFGLKGYKKDLKNIEGSVDYSTRTSVKKNSRLFSSTLKFKDLGEINSDPPGSDRLILLFDEAATIILDKKFVENGMYQSSQTRAGLFAGDIEAAENTLPAVVTIRPETDEGMNPRWYGAGSSNASGSWTTGKLAQTILPDPLLEAVEGIYDILDNTEKVLNSALKGTSALNEKLRAIEKEVDEFFGVLEGIISLLKKLINSLSLSQLPSIYTAFWKGSSKQLPKILMDALSQKDWSTSTYAGMILFGNADAATAILEGYNIVQKMQGEYEHIEESLPSATKARISEMESIFDGFEQLKEDKEESGRLIRQSYKDFQDTRDRTKEKEANVDDAISEVEVITNPEEAYKKLIDLRPVKRLVEPLTPQETSKVSDAIINKIINGEEV